MGPNEMLTAGVHHLFLSASRAHEDGHVLGKHLLLLVLHLRQVSLGAGSSHCVGTGEILFLDVVNAVCHDHRRLTESLLVHLGVTNELSRFVFEFIHHRPAVLSLDSAGVHHGHVATCLIQIGRSRLVELLEVDVFKPLSACGTVSLPSSGHTGSCLQVTASVVIGREPTTGTMAGSVAHELMQLLLFQVGQVNDVAVHFLKLVCATSSAAHIDIAAIARAVEGLSRLHTVHVGGSGSLLDHEAASFSLNLSEIVINGINVTAVSRQLSKLLLPQPV